jgi:hypothetical protein
VKKVARRPKIDGQPGSIRFYQLQDGQAAQSQQVQSAHPQTPLLQQSQQVPATAAVTGDAAMAMMAEAMSNNVFMMFLNWKFQ